MPRKLLTLKQQKFVNAYLKTGNGTQSAIAAGYPESSAHSIATENLQKPAILAAIKRPIDRYEATPEKIVRELALLGFSNMQDYIAVDADGQASGLDLSQLTRDQAAAIQEITYDSTGGSGDGERKLVMRTRFKLAPKRDALELLGKFHKLFVDRVEVTGVDALAERLQKARKAAGK